MRDQTSVTVVRIPGRLQSDEPLWLASQIPTDSPLLAGASPARAFRLGVTGGRGSVAEAVIEEIPDNALVEIEFESGLCFWTAGADLRARVQAAGGDTTRGGTRSDDGAWELPGSITPPVGGARGLAGKLTIKAIPSRQA